MKKCPYCAEDIQDAAIICRFCQRDVPAPVVPAATGLSPFEVQQTAGGGKSTPQAPPVRQPRTAAEDAAVRAQNAKLAKVLAGGVSAFFVIIVGWQIFRSSADTASTAPVQSSQAGPSEPNARKILAAFKPSDYEAPLRRVEGLVTKRDWPAATKEMESLRGPVGAVVAAAAWSRPDDPMTIGFIGRYRTAENAITDANTSGARERSLASARAEAAQREANRLTAHQLFAAYLANEVSADATYKGKTIEFSGTVETIGKDILNTPYLALDAGPGTFGSVQAMFSRSDEQQLANISKGQRVVLRCTCTGKLMNVILRDCAIQ